MKSPSLSIFFCIALVIIDSSFGFWISDERVRGPDSAASLGRGYAMTANSFLSQCLEVNTTSSPSFDYYYEFSFISPSDTNTMLESTLAQYSDSFSYGKVKNIVKSTIDGREKNGNVQNTQNNKKKKYHILGNMKINRYYSSILESTARMSGKALTLLDKGDYVGFFKTCGTTYIRSIRRFQEVAVVFTFTTCSETLANQYYSCVERSSFGGVDDLCQSGDGDGENKKNLDDTDCTDTFDDIKRTLSIKIEAFGLGLTNNNGTLVVASLNEFNDVMKTAYTAMTRREYKSEEHAGKVHSMEVIHWTNNLSFQIASKMGSKPILRFAPLDQIPRARNGRCQQGGVEDDFGYCCSAEEQIDLADDEEEERGVGITEVDGSDGAGPGKYFEFNLTEWDSYFGSSGCSGNFEIKQCRSGSGERWVGEVIIWIAHDVCYGRRNEGQAEGQWNIGDAIVKKSADCVTKECDKKKCLLCQPTRPIPTSIMKHNAEVNGEFLAMMDLMSKSNDYDLSRVTKCVKKLKTQINADSSSNYRYLTPISGGIQQKVAIKELLMILDPTGDDGLTTLARYETSEYKSMFADRCYSALYTGEDHDLSDGATIEDSQFFFANPYHEHEECSYSSCTYAGARWDRDNPKGGCVRGILKNGPKYTNSPVAAKDSSCVKIFNRKTRERKCKYAQEDLVELQHKVKTCWESNSVVKDNPNFRLDPVGLVEAFCLGDIDESSRDIASQQSRIRIDQMARSCTGYHELCDDSIENSTRCPDDYFCYDGTALLGKKTCEPANTKEIGESCLEHRSCKRHESKTYCVYKDNLGYEACMERKKNGDECTHPYECLGRACVNEKCGCKKDNRECRCTKNVHCERYESDTFCDKDSVCKNRKKNGDECTHPYECLGRACVNEKCGCKKDNRECRCTKNVHCERYESDTFCDKDSVCKNRKKNGDECTHPYECLGRACSDLEWYIFKCVCSEDYPGCHCSQDSHCYSSIFLIECVNQRCRKRTF